MILLSCDVEGEGEYHGPAVRLCKTSILPRNLARRSFVRKGAVILLALIGCALQPVARAARAHSKLPPPAPPPGRLLSDEAETSRTPISAALVLFAVGARVELAKLVSSRCCERRLSSEKNKL